MRFFIRLVTRCREAWADKPLFVRISAAEWADGPEKDDEGVWKQWGIEQSTILVGKLKETGVDLIDCSAGGNWVHQDIPIGPGYQASSGSRRLLSTYTLAQSFKTFTGSLCRSAQECPP